MKKHMRRVALGALLTMTLHAAAQAPRPIVVGQTLVQSGPLADLSSAPASGVRALFHAVNASGGVHGRPLELRQADDAYDDAKAAENVKAFARQGAVAILMPIGTTSSSGALKAANEIGLPLIGPYSGAAPLRKHTPYGFPVRIGFSEEYDRIVQHLFTIGIERIAFACNDNPGARSAMEGTRRSIEQRGRTMAASVAVANDGADAQARAQELSRSRPGAVVLSMTTAVAAKFIAAYRATGVPAQFYSFSFLNGAQLQRSIAADATGVVVSQVVPYPWNSAMPLVVAYQAAMRKIGITEFDHASFEGYVNAKVLVEGLRRAGPGATPESLKAALEGFGALDLGGITVHYGPGQHTGLGFSELTMVRADGGYAR
jgi:branched-chain amino acid transport system substrate-binding protein